MLPKIISIVDTRDYEEGPDDRFHPIPGSGNPRPCDRCGRDHEVHATVEYEDGRIAIVGTSCMGHSKEYGRKCAASAATLARLNAELAKYRASLDALNAAWAKVETMPIPEITEGFNEYHTDQRVYNCGDACVWLQFCRTEEDFARRRQEVARDWQRNRVRDILGRDRAVDTCYDILNHYIRDTEDRIAKAKRRLEQATQEASKAA